MKSAARILVIGTGNKHKVGEIAPLLAGLPVTLKAAGEYGPFEPVENGQTLQENAIIKARAAMELSGEWAIADDTGLDVDALGGRPGIFAARYAGEGCTFADNVRKLLRELEGVPPQRRTAAFCCAIALCRPGSETETFEGRCPGWIALRERGGAGFGYDPIFEVEQGGMTFAEISAELKNRISHRARAVRLCRERLAQLLKNS